MIAGTGGAASLGAFISESTRTLSLFCGPLFIADIRGRGVSQC